VDRSVGAPRTRLGASRLPTFFLLHAAPFPRFALAMLATPHLRPVYGRISGSASGCSLAIAPPRRGAWWPSARATISWIWSPWFHSTTMTRLPVSSTQAHIALGLDS